MFVPFTIVIVTVNEYPIGIHKGRYTHQHDRGQADGEQHEEPPVTDDPQQISDEERDPPHHNPHHILGPVCPVYPVRCKMRMRMIASIVNSWNPGENHFQKIILLKTDICKFIYKFIYNHRIMPMSVKKMSHDPAIIAAATLWTLAVGVITLPFFPFLLLLTGTIVYALTVKHVKSTVTKYGLGRAILLAWIASIFYGYFILHRRQFHRSYYCSVYNLLSAGSERLVRDGEARTYEDWLDRLIQFSPATKYCNTPMQIENWKNTVIDFFKELGAPKQWLDSNDVHKIHGHLVNLKQEWDNDNQTTSSEGVRQSKGNIRDQHTPGSQGVVTGNATGPRRSSRASQGQQQKGGHRP